MIEIENDNDLQIVADEVSERLQAIDDYLRAKPNAKWTRVRFPRGYLMSVTEIKTFYRFISDKVRRTNVAYTVILIQALNWLLSRTDITLTARSMLCKVLVALRGSVVEVILIETVGAKSADSFAKRAARLTEAKIIDERLEGELNWLWDKRCQIHLDKPLLAEHLSYSDKDAVRALKALVELRQAVSASGNGSSI